MGTRHRRNARLWHRCLCRYGSSAPARIVWHEGGNCARRRAAHDGMAGRRHAHLHDWANGACLSRRNRSCGARMNAPEIVTFGCRLNAYESEAIRARAREAGLTNAIVFNTCAVTAEAVRQSRQAIRKARREQPDARIIVTGCAAQTEPDMYAAMPEIDFVLGNREKLETSSYADFGVDETERVRVNDIFSVRETASQYVDSFDGRARAFVQVQNGCDHRCTFCIIPYGRGNSRSVPMGAVIDETRRLLEKGFGEIVLTGVDLTGYGTDLPGAPTLGHLCAK